MLMLKLSSVSKEFAKIARERLGKRLIFLALYGSVARGKASKESDIDIFAIVADRKAKDELFGIASEYLMKGVLFSIIVETPAEFRKLREYPFTKSIFKEGEILYGRI